MQRQHSGAWRLALICLCLVLAASGALGLLTPKSIGAPAPALQNALSVSEDLPPHRERLPLAPAVAQAPNVKDPRAAQRLTLAVANAMAGSTAAVPAIAVAVEGLGKVVDMNGSAAMTPASTQKLYTGAAALMLLDPSSKFRTEIFRTGPIDAHGTLHGHLVVVGGGDPTLSKLQLVGQAMHLANSVGIRRIEGHVYVDESRFDAARSAPGWKPHYIPFNSGSLSAFAVDRNNWRTDHAYISDPAHGNVLWFHSALAHAGIHIAGAAAVGRPHGELSLLSVHESETLGSIVADMMKTSDNFAAEMLLKEVGRKIGAPSTDGGIDAIRMVTELLKLPKPASYDGSGLSAENKQSPWDQVIFLMRMESTPVGPIFKDSLAGACAPVGTMRNRLCGTPAAGRVHAKTGSLTAVTALSGYATTASGRRVWFSFLLGGVASPEAAKQAIDSALLEISSFTG